MEAMLRGKRERRDDPYHCTIDVSALAAIMVALVILLEVHHLPTAMSRYVSVDLPKAIHPVIQQNAQREDAIVITVMMDGKLYFRNDQVSPEKLSKLVAQGIEGGAKRKAYIYADARASYGMVLVALARVREAGVEDVAFITEQGRGSR